MAHVNNWPTGRQPDVTDSELAADIEQKMTLAATDRINLSDPKQIKDRMQFYFQKCREWGRRPGIEGLCLALHVSRQSLWKWQHEDTERGELARTAKQLILSQLESWNIEGKLNPASSIFLLKNWAGYTDAVQLEAVDNRDHRPTYSPEEIARMIETDIPAE